MRYLVATNVCGFALSPTKVLFYLETSNGFKIIYRGKLG